MSKFKVGDKVRTRANCGDAKIGEEYIVQESLIQSDRRLCIAENVAKRTHCSCCENWELVPNLPEKWCIKPKNEQELKEVYKYCCKVSEAKSTTCYYHYPAFSSNCWASRNIQPGYTEITFEEFKKYILDTTDMKDKKIIGYKAPVDMYSGGVQKGHLFVTNASDSYKPQGEVSTLLERELVMPSSIVETWEPVYEDDKIMLGKWEVKFNSNKTVSIGCSGSEKTYVRGDVEAIQRVLQLPNIKINAIIFGDSSEEVLITTEICDKILKRLNEN